MDITAIVVPGGRFLEGVGYACSYRGIIGGGMAESRGYGEEEDEAWCQ